MMKLIGMLDSPFVRRVAISMQLLDIEFDHQALSVFRDFDRFQAINPAVKAPTLICDEGQALMDSTLILSYLDTVSTNNRSLMPHSMSEYQLALRIVGLALTACEKSVQLVYEQMLRPEEKRHQPWIDRVRSQLTDCYRLLEQEASRNTLAGRSDNIRQTGITTACAWYFTQQMNPGVIDPNQYPTLAKYSEQVEQLTEFKAASFHADQFNGDK
ncbi:glutathione S-transferase [Neiella marina]|uniref:Glutathione S-transferase n=1 Tax=Neiella holothuriorum TaxID=2870530 RepID=A0ABS7EH24_9GAMM|nr:glutathione S-transferase [Neiella holothuriorum]MBW8191081.1 glutathione S-transferase [Neiella holothuriorum]